MSIGRALNWSFAAILSIIVIWLMMAALGFQPG